ncbi:MAG TPA: FAD-dependent oxidoreductase, partial [Candidatus Acidoferrum sp.]|nr:FAD-dependent oxidoreductase [Candidatus Acidoferrum sp.]
MSAAHHRTYDFAVVGAGVFGAWIAHFLRASGASVALLDAYGPANSRASSGGESRIIRMGYGPDEIYTQWAMRALPLWKQLFADAGRPELFHETGVLWIAPKDDAYALAAARALSKFSVEHEILSLDDLRSRYSHLSFDDDSWGILEMRSGILMARRAVQTVVERACSAGVDYFPEAVLPPSPRGRVTGLSTVSGGRISAGSFVFACGPWLGKIFPEILGNRVFPSRQEVFFFGPPAGSTAFHSPSTPTWLYLKDEFYGMPDVESRGFKLAHDRHGPAADPDTQPRTISPEALAFAREFLARRFPALRDAPLVESRVCQYENTSNGDFLVDHHLDHENVWFAGGGSGHGFKHGPSMGEYVAGILTRGGEIEPRFRLASKDIVQRR